MLRKLIRYYFYGEPVAQVNGIMDRVLYRSIYLLLYRMRELILNSDSSHIVCPDIKDVTIKIQPVSRSTQTSTTTKSITKRAWSVLCITQQVI